MNKEISSKCLAARAKFCEIEAAYYVKCYTIEQYSVIENIELCTMFYSDELEAEDFSDDESADDNRLPTTLRGNIIAASHLRSVVDDNRLLLDIRAPTSIKTQYTFSRDALEWLQPSAFHAMSYICCARRVNFRACCDA